jgi:hypothetical protein
VLIWEDRTEEKLLKNIRNLKLEAKNESNPV